MTISIAQTTANHGAASSYLPPDAQQLATDIARLAISDPGRAAQCVRDLMSSLPDSSCSDIAAAVTEGLDDRTLQGLCQMVAGRDLLNELATYPHDQVGRVHDALNAVASRSAGGLLSQIAQQAVHPGVLKSASATGNFALSDATNKEQVQRAFKEEFAAKAGNKQEFDAFMQQVFGDKYDKSTAEQFRQRALVGDFSFLPEVRFVDAATLHGNNGAYNAQEGVVYINKDVASTDPAKAAQTFVEEAGHHLDAQLNAADTQGDEGEMFRRVLGDEQLSTQQVADIRAENDHGTIIVDGKQVDVEYWFGSDFVDGVADVATSVVDKTKEVVSDVVDHVGTAARDVVYSVGDAIKETGMGVIDGVGMFMRGFAVDFFGGTVLNLFQGRFADAFGSMTRGLDTMIFQAPRRILNGAIEGTGHWLKTATYLLPEKAGGALARNVIDRGVDSFRSVANAVVDVTRNTSELPFKIVGGFGHDLGEALKHWARGDVGEGFEHFGMAFVHPFERAAGTAVDDVMIVGQTAGNVFGNVFGIHTPSRGLSKEEREFLKHTYGESLNVEDIRIHRGNLTHDLGMAPHTVGNDIYLPDSCFDPETGALNEEGRMTLVHEGFHVYQAQHGGNGYIHEALEAQVGGIVDSGDRNAAYNWVDALRSGKPFDEWNPEQQAELIETLARAKTQRLDTNRTTTGLEGSYDANRDGQLDQIELETAARDLDRDGHIDAAENTVTGDTDGDGRMDAGENRLDLTDDEFRRVLAIAAGITADRPDRTVV